MTVIGWNNNNGKSTLYLTMDFPAYYSNPEAGRACTGKMAKSVYVGDLDISGLKVGSEVEILYGEAIATKNGTYSPVKRIELVK